MSELLKDATIFVMGIFCGILIALTLVICKQREKPISPTLEERVLRLENEARKFPLYMPMERNNRKRMII